MPPADRQKRILDNLKRMNEAFTTDPYAKAFGINISDKMTKINGRVLEPPSLGYNGGKSFTLND